MGSVLRAVWVGLAMAGIAGAAFGQATAPSAEGQGRPDGLPDYSYGTTGVLGPFIWSRASNVGEDCRFGDANGLPQKDGEYLWFYGFARLAAPKGQTNFIHARCNLVSALPALAYSIQPMRFLHNTPGPHNSKIIFGYIESSARFQNGDNADLAHLADGDRVVVFLPVRHNGNPKDNTDQEIYHVNPHYGAQAPCVIEFKKGEMIHYEWFSGGPGKLDKHVLFDLRPHIANPEASALIKPGVDKPLLKFDLLKDGGWRLQIKRDGREAPKDLSQVKWDMTFTHESAGAKRASVNVTPDNSSFALSVFSPGGGPTDSSEIVVGLRPYERATDKPAAWPERSRRFRDVKLDELDSVLRGSQPGKASGKKGTASK